MFEKKVNILPPPFLPGIRQLLADLNHTHNHDVIFARVQQHLDNLLRAADVHDEDDNANISEDDDTEKLYRRLKKIVITNSVLHDYVNTLEQLNDTLEVCDHELKQLLEEMRNQNNQQMGDLRKINELQ